jgi:hypothetical protein
MDVMQAVRKSVEDSYTSTDKAYKRFMEHKERYPRLVEFFDRVMWYYLYEPEEGYHENFESMVRSCVKTSLYGMLEKVGGYYDVHTFIPTFLSFLVNTCLDDSYFKIEWVQVKMVEGKIEHVVSTESNGRATPVISWSNDDFGTQDVELLHYALDRMEKHQRDYMEMVRKNWD